jgi:hypothetical protein
VILGQALIAMVLVVMRLYMLVLVAGCQRCLVLGNIMETTRGMGVVIDMQQIIQLAILPHGIDLHVTRLVQVDLGVMVEPIFRRSSRDFEPLSAALCVGIVGYYNWSRRSTRLVIGSSLYIPQIFILTHL